MAALTLRLPGQDCDPAFIFSVMLSLQLEVFMTGDTVVWAGEIAREMCPLRAVGVGALPLPHLHCTSRDAPPQTLWRRACCECWSRIAGAVRCER